MKKQKLALLTFLVAVISVCCLMFGVACNTAPKYAINWNVAPEITVKVTGYDANPKELEEGVEVSFTLEFKQGYELGTISGAKADSNGVYKFTVGTKEVNIKITAVKTISSLEVTNPVKTYYAGEEVDLTKVSVKVNYATGDNETVTGDKCTIAYKNGSAFSLGDTSYTVRYGKGSKEVTLDGAVVGLVTLNLAGGRFSDADLAKLPAGYAISEDSETISWTFTEAFAEDFAIPSPLKTVEEVEFDFIRWSGNVEKDVITKGTAVSVTATAFYEIKLVKLSSIGLSIENAVPYLTLIGNFQAATEVYFYLYEGNKPPVELVGPTITKQGTSSAFTCKFDLTELAKKADYKGKWMDIKLRSKLGDRLETQEIDLNSYDEDFIIGSRSISTAITGVEGVNDGWYTFDYQYWTPKAGDEISGAPGTYYLGTENLLKIQFNYSENLPDYILTGTTLEKRSELPYLVITGKAVALESKAELETALAGYIKDIQNFSSWATLDVEGKLTVTVNDDLTFGITLCIDGIKEEGLFIMHTQDGNFDPSDYDTTAKIKIGTWEYSLTEADPHGWGWAWTCIKCENPALAANKSVILEGGKPLFVLMGAADGKTAEEIKAQLTQFDFENEADSADKTVIAPEKITVTIEGDFYLVKVDISELKLGKYWVHAVGLVDGNGDVAPNASRPAVTVGEKTYCGIDEKKDWGTAHLLQVAEASYGVTEKVATVSLAKEGEKAIYIVHGVVTCKDYKDDAAIVADLVKTGGLLSGLQLADLSGNALKTAIGQISVDFQKNPYAVTGAWDGDGNDWSAIDLVAMVTSVTVTVARNLDENIVIITYDAKYDITDMAAYKYTGHYGFKDNGAGGADLKPTESYESEVITIGTKTYKLEVTPNTDDGAKYWGCPGLTITAAE